MSFLNYCEFQLAVLNNMPLLTWVSKIIFITRWAVSISRADKPRRLPAAAYSCWSDGWVRSFSQEMQWEPLAHSLRHPESSQVRGWKHPQASTDRTERNLQTEHSLGASVVQEFRRFFPSISLTPPTHFLSFYCLFIFSTQPFQLKWLSNSRCLPVFITGQFPFQGAAQSNCRVHP